jgi:hypothetical protein
MSEVNIGRESFQYPEDVQYSQEIPGVYDGVCVWFLKDGRILNRFADENSNRSLRIDRWIEEYKAEQEAKRQ